MDLGGNGLIMLELLSSIIWEKKKQFTVEHIRAKFDCTDTYPAIGEFNRQVINKAISDVNEHTDIVARYETIAAGGGKKITHYIFHAAKKPKAIKKNNQKTTDEDGQSIERKLGKLKKGLSDAQIKKLATRKDDFIQVNLHMVKPPHCQNSCHPHLNNPNGEKGDNHGTIQCRTQTSYTEQTFIT